MKHTRRKNRNTQKINKERKQDENMEGRTRGWERSIENRWSEEMKDKENWRMHFKEEAFHRSLNACKQVSNNHEEARYERKGSQRKFVA